jgi:hypothetical protein
MYQKFSFRRFLRSHKGIPKEEREFVKLLYKVMIMAELYWNLPMFLLRRFLRFHMRERM